MFQRRDACAGVGRGIVSRFSKMMVSWPNVCAKTTTIRTANTKMCYEVTKLKTTRGVIHCCTSVSRAASRPKQAPPILEGDATTTALTLVLIVGVKIREIEAPRPTPYCISTVHIYGSHNWANILCCSVGRLESTRPYNTGAA